jgi:mRNA-degrading endonuclease YafQ of YafQ-DinJ toxin-antitoxin module
MKFQRTPHFVDNYKFDISDDGRDDWDQAFPDLVKALQGDSQLYKHFRLQKMEGRPGRNGIWEGHIKQDLCFTFQFDYLPKREKVCLFRRIGTHKIYKKP